MLEKTYEPAGVEERIYKVWIDANAFAAGAGAKPGADAYCIVIPPPNVTGSLHIGHALNNTIQDILIRFERMRGRDVLWQPGTDHAGIATQMIVERQLMERQEKSRREMGREAFIKRVWEWKEKSGGEILGQLKRLGASADWSRERFTMDEGLSRAVLKVFVTLYNEGLIYRAKRLVNWHPGLQTAISDLEVENIEVQGHLWHLRYPIEGSDEFIVVATTRPETMLGDTAVAVNPEDGRYAEYVKAFEAGRPYMVRLPLVGRLIPIVADDYADPEQGSGAVKITPAHDFNDFEVGERHKLEKINIFAPDATINDNAPERYRGLDRFAARKAVLADLEALGAIDKVEDKLIMVPHDEKSKQVVIEPYLTDQWFVDAKTLAGPAIASVKEGRTNFVPKSWENTYFAWMNNIQPWCISRQLWWGHQIPVWYGPNGKAFCAENYELAIEEAEAYYNELNDEGLLVQELASFAPSAMRRFDGVTVYAFNDRDSTYRDRSGRERARADSNISFSFSNEESFPHVELTLARDPDVLDTWFSSALWPFSTLGWPDETKELKTYYQTDVLVTGFDIIFFWVARMMMMGLHFMKEEPFHTVYVHALVRDAQGAKMSKTKGNVINPLELIDQYGADATRFTLAAMAAQGRDLRLSLTRVEGYRNFVSKLWNAARFLEINECARVAGFDPRGLKQPLNRWIVGAAERAVASITRGIEEYKFNEAANAAYEFTWHTFCDWYVELAKPLLTGDDIAARDETRATAAWALDEILKLLHPFMPFVTEELWTETGRKGPKRERLLMLSEWPVAHGLADAKADAELDWLIALISGVRSVRAEMNVPPAAKVPLVVVGADDVTRSRLAGNGALIERLARIDNIAFADKVPPSSAQIVMATSTIALPLAGVIDLKAERDRLGKEVEKLNGEIDRIDKKLANEQFVAKAPEEVIEEQRSRRADYEDKKNRTEAALARLN